MSKRQQKQTNLAKDLGLDEPEDGVLAKAGGFARDNPVAAGGSVVMALTGCLIVANAVGLQNGRHPAPLFSTREWDTPPAQVTPQEGRPAQVQEVSVLVLDLQTAFRKAGIYVGPLDGINGPATEQAIRQYERLLGRPETGLPTEELLATVLMRGVETPGVSGQAGPAGTPVAGAPFPRPKPDTRTGSIPAPRSVASTPVPPPPATRQIATAPAPANPPRGAGRSASSSGQAPVPPEVIPAPQADTRLVQIQRLLADLGYGPLAADGRMGDNTSKAIQRFQLDRGLPLTGLPTADVVERLEMVSGQNITN